MLGNFQDTQVNYERLPGRESTGSEVEEWSTLYVPKTQKDVFLPSST